MDQSEGLNNDEDDMEYGEQFMNAMKKSKIKRTNIEIRNRRVS